MSEPSTSPAGQAAGTTADRQAALFTSMVLQQANLALMCLGRAPRPDSKEVAVDLEGATLFIDTLDMLEAKSRGNLTADEARLLRETLTSLRIAFVETSDREAARAATPASAASTSPAAPSTAPTPGEATPPPEDAEARKKFVKRY